MLTVAPASDPDSELTEPATMDRNPTAGRPRRAPGFALSALLALALGQACASPTAEPTITVEVAALQLADIADVCWDLRITNGPDGTGDLVLTRGESSLVSPADSTTLCASRFGQGGDITFVAPCDASLERPSSVTVWLDSLWESGAGSPSTTYRDPCENGCTLDITCRENADSRATFDITVMRDARQGFFDMAVTFGDIFCSAKLDTCDAESRPNLLLFGADGARLPTAVLALACIGGPDATAPTQLHTADVVVTCEGQAPIVLELGSISQLGNQPSPAADDDLRWAVYAGSGPPPGGGAATLDYLNVAIATSTPSCAVSWQATASEGPDLPGDASTPGLYVYPIIETDEVPITGINGAWLCERHPLDGPLSRVATTYRQRTTRGAPGDLVAPNGSSWSGGARVTPDDPDDPDDPDTGPADTTAPFVTALAVPSGGNYVQGQALQFTLTFSEPILTAPLRLPIVVGDKELTLVPLGITPSTASVVTFRYSVGPDDLAQTGIAVGPALLAAYTDVAGNTGDPTLPSAGALPAVRVNDMPLALTAFTPPPNGWYLEGELLTFTVTYNRAVALDDSGGSPTIDFTLGSSTGTARSATYLDGAELGVLRFAYEIIDGENDPDGIAMTVGQVVLNGATLSDTIPVDEDQTPPAAPRTFTIPNLSGIRIDTVSPTLTTVTRPASATYTLGQTLRTTLTFSEPIVASGTPRIELIIGSRVVYAPLTVGNGTTTLHFDYVVQSGDYADVEDGGVEMTELVLSGATLEDLAGHAPNLDAFVPAVWTAVFVDAVAAPSIVSVVGPTNGNYRVGESLLFTVTFSEPVVITPYHPTVNAPPTRPALQLTIGSTTRYATWLDEGPSATHVFEYVIVSGDVDTNGIALVSPLLIQSSSYPIRSEEWNKDAIRTFTPPNLSGVLVENVANTDAITITSLSVPTAKYYRNTRIMSFTAYFNRSLTLSATNGTRPRIAIRIGDKVRYAESYYLSGTRSSLLMRYTVQTEDEDHDGIEILSSAIELNGGSLTASGNPPIDLTLPVVDTSGVKVDGLLATIVAITPPESRQYLLNEVISFHVTFSEPVYVTYTPRLRLNIRTGGSTIRSARYAAGSGTNVLRFDYKVGTSDEDQDGVALSVTGTPTSPITLGTSTRIRDLGGNNAYLLYTTNDAYPDLRVDGIVPKVTSVARSPSTTVYLQPGATADFLVNYGEAVVVTGTPRLRIVVGTTTRYALYRPDLSTPTQLVFRHTILPGERDSNGIAIYSPLELDGGSVRDLPGNTANLNLYSIASMTGLRVGCSDVATKYRYGYSSLRTYTNTKPAGCFKLTFKLWGAGGGASYYTSEGGGGGFAMGTLDVSNLTAFTVVLGVRGSATTSSTSTTRRPGYNGFNGGFARYGGGQGAGASAIVVDNVPLAIVGGGGGGGAGGMSTSGSNPARGGASNLDGGQSAVYAAACLDVSARGRVGPSWGIGGLGGCAPGGLACGTDGVGGVGGDAGFGAAAHTGGGSGGGGAAGGGGGAGLCGNGGAGGLTAVANDPRLSGVVVQAGSGRNPGGTDQPEYSSSYGKGGTPSSRAGQYSRLVYYWQ